MTVQVYLGVSARDSSIRKTRKVGWTNMFEEHSLLRGRLFGCSQEKYTNKAQMEPNKLKKYPFSGITYSLGH